MTRKPPNVLAIAHPARTLDPELVLNALTSAVVVIDRESRVVTVNSAAEPLLGGSADHLCGEPLTAFVPADNPLFTLIDQVRAGRLRASEYGIVFDSPRVGRHFLNVHVTPLIEAPGHVVLTMHERSIADKINNQMTHRGAARSVTAMAAVLAHEVKNPLSGIRGAAQLLEQNASSEDRTLTQLICDEADRICGLVDRMEVFSDKSSFDRGPVNIHQVLERVRRLAESGFGKGVRFLEYYDPSLPPVHGDRDQLVQVFLNLVKNAVEAVPKEGGEVILTTAYQHGVRLAVTGHDSRVHLPLIVTVQDNGSGIPEDLQPHMFDPFVTNKAKGSGLGLSLVAKIIDDHGGVIEFDSTPRRTIFRLMLPVWTEPMAAVAAPEMPSR